MEFEVLLISGLKVACVTDSSILSLIMCHRVCQRAVWSASAYYTVVFVVCFTR